MMRTSPGAKIAARAMFIRSVPDGNVPPLVTKAARIPTTNIATMTTSRLSLMPQELEKTMTRQELADLLAFLKGQ